MHPLIISDTIQSLSITGTAMSFVNLLWAPLKKKGSPEKDIVDIIKHIPVFKNLNKLELILVAKILHRRTYHSNELVFKEHEAGNGMYIIQSGSIKITGTHGQDTEVIYAELHKGEFFGELALVDGSPRSATAKGNEDCTLLGFFKPDLLELIEKSPKTGSKILLNLSAVLGERLRKMNQQNIELSAEVGTANV